MDNPSCDICGAVVLDTGKHRSWHDDEERRIQRAIIEAFRDLKRRATAFGAR